MARGRKSKVSASRRGGGSDGERKRRVLTECQSAHSKELDEYGPIDIVRATRACESEIFQGYQGYPSLSDREVQRKLEEAARSICDAVRDDESGEGALVVFSGAGTSGRLCWAACQLLSHLAKERRVKLRCACSLAGGNVAFKKAVEHAEDDAASAKAALDRIVGGAPGKTKKQHKNLVLVGVTCGMSATWVASQIRSSLEWGGRAVLMGFTPFEGCRGLFAEPDVYNMIAGGGDRVVVLDPVVGPELVTGSTRLKSGTATKICLEVVIITAMGYVIAEAEDPPSDSFGLIATARGLVRGLVSSMAAGSGARAGFVVPSLLEKYEKCLKIFGKSMSLLNPFEIDSHPLSIGAATLRMGGRIAYAGFGREGLLGLVDASEQLPTFGCQETDFQGFLLDRALPEEVVEVVGEERGVARFQTTMASFGPNDTIVLILNLRRLARTRAWVAEASAAATALFESQESKGETHRSKVVSLVAVPRTLAKNATLSSFLDQIIDKSDSVIDIYLDDDDELAPSLGADYDLGAEIGIKCALNCFSSGCNVLNGKVYGNVMIDVRISNKKLLERAISIVTGVAEVDRAVAFDSVIRALGLRKFCGAERLRQEEDLRECIEHGSGLRKVVPTAVLLATGRYATPEEARGALGKLTQGGSSVGDRRTLRDIIKDSIARKII